MDTPERILPAGPERSHGHLLRGGEALSRLRTRLRDLASSPVATRLRRGAGRAALATAAFGYLGAMAVTCAVVGATRDLPELSALTERTRPVSIQIVDRYGRDLVVRGASEAGRLDAATLPRHLVDAVVAVEDRRFAHHIGVDAEALARAALANHRTGRRGQGGSTLTQQLVKNVFLSPEKTYRRKVQEALLAVWMERLYTKSEILEMYLERVYFGSGTWGLSAASRTYFDARPEDLTLAQSAMLAGLLRAPSSLNPLARPDAAGERAALVLGVMEGQGRITRAERADALAAPLSIRPPQHARGVNHFADWVWADLEARLGLITTDIVVQTTLDRDLQASAEAAVAAHLNAGRGAEEAALVTLDASGGVLAMVGGASYAASQFNRATQARRQPGSAFKPFVYLSAFEAGWTPWTRVVDAPVDLAGWEPENFDARYRGELDLEEAVAASLNTVAVSTTEAVGRARVVGTAARLGLSGLVPVRSLPLGSQGVAPLALAEGYLPFANRGRAAPAHGILSVSTAQGLPLMGSTAVAPREVVAGEPLRHLNRVLTRAVEAGTGRRAAVPGRHVAGKTGTTNDHRDAWFAGYAPGVTTVVWVGNDANDPMDGVTGGSIPATIFADHMARALEGTPRATLPVSSPPIWREDGDALEALLADAEAVLP